MRAIVTATLIALSLATPALAEKVYELPASNAMERLQLVSSAPEPAQGPALKNPWVAAGLTLSSPLLLAGGAYALGAQPDVPIPLGTISVVGGAGPLTLGTGYLYAGDFGRGTVVMLGGYVAQLMGAVVGAPTVALLSGKEGEGAGWAFVSGLFIGPMVALGVYSLWAAFDAYQATVRHNEHELTAAETPATP